MLGRLLSYLSVVVGVGAATAALLVTRSLPTFSVLVIGILALLMGIGLTFAIRKYISDSHEHHSHAHKRS